MSNVSQGQQGVRQPSSTYVEKLKAFELEPGNVLEKIAIEPDSYVVFISTPKIWATYQTADGFQLPAGALGILSRATFIQSIPVQFPEPDDDVAFRRIVATGIELALAGEIAGANQRIDDAEGYVQRRAAEMSRFWHIQSSLLTAGAFVIFGMFSEGLKWGWPTGDGSWRNLGMATAFGAIGALFSFLQRLRGHEVDVAAGWKAHYGDAFVRIFLGALGAFIFAVGIRANFVLGFLAENEPQTTWLLYLFCAAAGFSERLVPNFLQQVEGRALEEKDTSTKKDVHKTEAAQNSETTPVAPLSPPTIDMLGFQQETIAWLNGLGLASVTTLQETDRATLLGKPGGTEEMIDEIQQALLGFNLSLKQE